MCRKTVQGHLIGLRLGQGLEMNIVYLNEQKKNDFKLFEKILKIYRFFNEQKNLSKRFLKND